MNDFELSDVIDESAKKIINHNILFIIDAIESLTFNELLDIQNSKNYEEYYQRWRSHDLVWRTYNNSNKEYEFDQVIGALYDRNQTDNLLFQNREKIISLLESHWNPIDGIIYSFLYDINLVYDKMIQNYSLLTIKVALEYLSDISRGHSISNGNYQLMLKCKCGRMYSAHTTENGQLLDTREFLKCCKYCGRCCSTWKQVSATMSYLIKPSSRKILNIFSNRKEKISMGYIISDHSIADLNYSKYQLFQIKKQKTLLESGS